MLSDLYNLFLAAIRIQSQRRGLVGVRIFLAYTRLKIKNRYYLWRKRSPRREQFLGYELEFFSYPSFVYLVEEIFVNGLYQFTASRPRPLILDCGSNIGLSVLYFKTIYPGAHIIAFEPDANTFAVLKRNVERNDLADVELHNVALSDAAGTVFFHTEQSGSLSASLLSGRGEKDALATPVQCRTLSSVIDGKVDFMKMDIEGAEAFCIPEIARAGKLQSIGKMVIECHHNLASDNTILTKVMSTLEANAFSYQVSSVVRLPVVRQEKQDVMLYAFRNDTADMR